MSTLIEKVTQPYPILDIKLTPSESKNTITITDKGQTEKLISISDNDCLHCKFTVLLNGLQKFDHSGIKISLVGIIDIPSDSSLKTEFLVINKEIQSHNTLTKDTIFEILFKFDKQFESYYGNLMQLKYFVKATILRNYSYKLEFTKSFAVLKPNPQLYHQLSSPTKIEIGFENLLHLEVEIKNTVLHLEDILIGKVYFLLVNIPIKSMEFAIIKQETIYSNPPSKEQEKISKFEIMDGKPEPGDMIPFRLNLRQVQKIGPTMNYIGGKFSVKHLIQIQIIDDNNEKFFKNYDIQLYRAR